MIDFQIFQDVGAVTGGRGTPIEVVDFNMKDSPTYSVAYYPTNQEMAAPLVRPLNAGEQDFSFKVYTFFKLSGTYSKIKNPRFRIRVSVAAQASGAQLFYKLSNVYETPTNTLDGDMMLLADSSGTIMQDPIYMNLSTVGPNAATSRDTVYANVSPLYTNYFVTQMRVNKGSLVGNTAEFTLKFEATEYYEVN